MKSYTVEYTNSAILAGSGKGFLKVTESVSEEQLERLKGFPFVHGLKILRVSEV